MTPTETQMQTRPLSPDLRNRDDFQPGTPIRLSDGNAWQFPHPTLEGYRFAKGDDGRNEVRVACGFGPDYERLLDQVTEAETGLDEALALFGLAENLLRRNYDLTFDEAAVLLRRNPADEAMEGAWGEIADVALGRAPKPTPVG